MERKELEPKQKMLLIAFVVALFAAIVFTASEDEERTDQPGHFNLSWSQTRAVTAAVKEELRDPRSASFSSISATKDEDGKITVCGFVDARNAFGVMAGPRLFYVPLHENNRAGIAWLSDESLTAGVCYRSGLISVEMYRLLTRN